MAEADPTQSAADRSATSRKALVAMVGGAVGLLAGFLLVVTLVGGGGDDYEIVIPEGTGAAVDAGEDVDVVPTEIEVPVGDTLVLINEDTRPHVVGPFTVMADDEYRYTFDREERFSGGCSAHPDREITIAAV